MIFIPLAKPPMLKPRMVDAVVEVEVRVKPSKVVAPRNAIIGAFVPAFWVKASNTMGFTMAGNAVLSVMVCVVPVAVPPPVPIMKPIASAVASASANPIASRKLPVPLSAAVVTTYFATLTVALPVIVGGVTVSVAVTVWPTPAPADVNVAVKVATPFVKVGEVGENVVPDALLVKVTVSVKPVVVEELEFWAVIVKV